MKGIMFNLLEGFVTEGFCADSWEEIIAACHLQTQEPFLMVGPGTYSDGDFSEIVQKSALHCKTPPEELLVDLGRYILPKLALRYPKFFTPYSHPRDFLKFTGMIHQTEVKKLYKDADTPHFSCREIDPNHIVLTYASKRYYPRLVEGLLYGLGMYYGVPTTIQMHPEEGSSTACEFDLQFAGE